MQTARQDAQLTAQERRGKQRHGLQKQKSCAVFTGLLERQIIDRLVDVLVELHGLDFRVQPVRIATKHKKE
jgi:hypothetical protein